MSTKHFFADAPSLVSQNLKALVESYPGLGLIEDQRVIYNKNHNSNNVAVISGGGSGHEPAWSGLVGDGLLAAAVNGPIFGSPSAKQILKGIDSVPSKKGVILAITNYTGDKLHFGLACEKAKAKYASKNIPFIVLPVTDDVALGRSREGSVGRRGLAGNLLVLKAMGAAAAQSLELDQVVSIGSSVNANLVTIGSSLDHCHVPGRQNHETLPDDTCVIGMGIHNEPGFKKLSPMPATDVLLTEMIRYLVDPTDAERAYVKFEPTDSVVMLVNNFGGLSGLELGALTYQSFTALRKAWKIDPSRVFYGSFESSLNAPGFSVSLLNVTKAAAEAEISEAELFAFLDDPTSAPSWPNVVRTPVGGSYLNADAGNASEADDAVSYSADLYVDPTKAAKVVETGFQRAVEAEPNLTKWDMIMGDGDCGDGVKSMSLAVLEGLKSDESKKESMMKILDTISTAVDDMGGTLGAILGIFVASYTSSMAKRIQRGGLLDEGIFAECCSEALDSLELHTSARVGDRTVMDVIIPFCNIFSATKSLEQAVLAAEQAANSTRNMKPKFGRATYVTTSEDEEMPPDPGAWAIYEIVKGFYDGTVM
ncbi:Dak1 domain-containing protein [Dipodascopsis uninucleata]